jgi:hypothetical protein
MDDTKPFFIETTDESQVVVVGADLLWEGSSWVRVTTS